MKFLIYSKKIYIVVLCNYANYATTKKIIIGMHGQCVPTILYSCLWLSILVHSPPTRRSSSIIHNSFPLLILRQKKLINHAISSQKVKFLSRESPSPHLKCNRILNIDIEEKISPLFHDTPINFFVPYIQTPPRPPHFQKS